MATVEWNNFSNFEFLCHCDASHQVTAQSDLGFGRRCRLKNFKMAAIWISEWNDFSYFESLCHWDASHQVSAQSDLGFRRRCCLKNFKMAAHGHLGYRNGTILAILNLCVTVIVMPPIKFQLNRT